MFRSFLRQGVLIAFFLFAGNLISDPQEKPFGITHDKTVVLRSQASHWEESLYRLLHHRVSWNDFLLEGVESTENQNGLQPSPEKYPQTILELTNLSDNGYFSGRESKIKIPHGKLGSFGSDFFREDLTLSFLIRPSSQKEILQILNKTIYREGIEFGLELLVNNGVLEVNLPGFFIENSGKRTTGKITSRYPLAKREFNRITISFQPAQKLVILYLGNKESGRYQAPSAVGMGFHSDDSTDLQLGKDYYGAWKDFLIHRGMPNLSIYDNPYSRVDYNPDSKFVQQILGVALSPVYKTSYSYSFMKEISWKRKLQEDQLLEVWIRASVFPFSANIEPTKARLDKSLGLGWIRLENFLERPICGESDSRIRENCFHYFQYKLVFKPDPSGKNVPVISDLSSRILQTRPPRKVVGLKIDKKSSDPDNLKVCLHWVANDESNVWNGGSYSILYGFSPNQPTARIDFHNPKPRNKEKVNQLNLKETKPISEKRVSVLKTCIDNTTIRQEAEKRKYEKNLPFFRHGTTVYFFITAQNRFYSETGPGADQSGPISKPVVISFPSKQ